MQLLHCDTVLWVAFMKHFELEELGTFNKELIIPATALLKEVFTAPFFI